MLRLLRFNVAVPKAPPRVAFHASPLNRGLEEFFANQQPGKTGRAWHASELRLKSFEDLRKLWFVLLKERNMLATYKEYCRQTQTVVANRERLQKVRLSMARLKEVVGSRSLEHKMETDPKAVARQSIKTNRRRKERQTLHRLKFMPAIQQTRVLGIRPLAKKIKFRNAKPLQAPVPAALSETATTS